MRQSVTVVTAPTLQPVGSDRLIAWARLDENEDEQTLDLLIETATTAAERYMNRSLVNRTLKLTLDAPACAAACRLGDGVYDLPESALYGEFSTSINLPRGIASSITSVKTYDTSNTETTYSSSNYTLDSSGSRLLLNNSATWPTNLRGKAAIAITYVAGYGATADSVPSAIRQGILIHAATLYEQRGQCSDEVPAACRQLYAPFRIYGGTVA